MNREKELKISLSLKGAKSAVELTDMFTKRRKKIGKACVDSL